MTSALVTAEIQKLSPSAIVELFVVDSTAIAGDISYFHAGTNGLKANIVFQGQTYVRYPVEASGFEYSGNGQLPRPKFRVSNIMGSITALLLTLNDLVGASVTRKRTIARYLDAVNFPGSVNPEADPSAEFPEEIYLVDRKSSENFEVVEFELAAPTDVQGVKLPRRQIIQNNCPWIYRGPDCGYTGAPLYDVQDNLLTTAATAEGQAVLNTFAAIAPLKLLLDQAIATESAAAQAEGPACEYQFVDTNYSWNTVTNATPNSGVLLSSDSSVAGYGGSPVVLGAAYRIGVRVTPNAAELERMRAGRWTELRKIERWAVDSAACTAASAAYTAAISARTTAQSNYDSAIAAHEVALAALPEDDPLYLMDRCGKRLASCKLRFGANSPLPFGGYPSAALIR